MFIVDTKRRVQPNACVGVQKTGIARDLVLAVNLQNGIVRNAVNGELAVLTGTAATQSSSCGLTGKLFSAASYAFSKSNAPTSSDPFTILVIQNFKGSTSSFQTAVSFNENYALYAPITSSNTGCGYDTFIDSTTNLTATGTVTTGKTQTFVVTSNSTQSVGYLDGIKQITAAAHGDSWTSPVTVRIGSGQGGTEYSQNEIDLVLIWKRVLTDLEIKSISNNPWQVFQPYHSFIPSLPKKRDDTKYRPHSYDLTGNGWFDSDTVSPIAIFDKDLITLSSNITLALTGASVTTARGTLVANNSKALLGISSTSAQGTVTSTRTVAAVGTASTLSAGTVKSAIDKAITGGVITSSAGIISVATVDVTIAIGGSSISAIAGSLSVSVAKGATGQAVTLSAGTLTSGIDKAISGSSSTLSGGTLIPALSKVLTGTQLSASSGFVTSGNDVNVALSGIQFSALAGTLSVSVSKAATGSASTLAVGQIVPNTSKAITGSVSTLGMGSMTKTVSIAMLGGAVTPSAELLYLAYQKPLRAAHQHLVRVQSLQHLGLLYSCQEFS